MPIARTGEPDAPASFKGLTTKVNRFCLFLALPAISGFLPDILDEVLGSCLHLFMRLINRDRLHRFSIIRILFLSKIWCDGKLLSAPASMLGPSIPTAFIFFSTRYFAVFLDSPGFAVK